VRAKALLVLLAAAPAGASDWLEASAWNERALARLEAGDAAGADDASERALALLPGNPTLVRNAAAAASAHAAALLRAGAHDRALARLDRAVELDPERAAYRVQRAQARILRGRDVDLLFGREDLEGVLARDPEHFDALANLGEIAYRERRLDEAFDLWSRAVALRPDDSDLGRRLARAARERDVERTFEELRDPRFVVRFSPRLPREDAAAVLAACSDAYTELCRRLDHYPEGATIVTLYTSDEFRSATGVHAWVAGLSDGTVRLSLAPGSGASRAVRAMVFHEFTHHLVRRIAPRAPSWIHEGLAQLMEGRSRDAAEARLGGGDDFAPEILSGRALRDGDAAGAGRFYDVSLAFAAYLHERGGDVALHALTRALGEGAGEREAVRRALGADRDELFEAWRERLRRGRR
jgi:tetratricopeptide (TPR) repeat protein